MKRFGHAKRCYQNLTFWLNLGTTKTYSKILYFVIDKKNPICKILAAFCIYQEIFRKIKFWSCCQKVIRLECLLECANRECRSDDTLGVPEYESDSGRTAAC